MRLLIVQWWSRPLEWKSLVNTPDLRTLSNTREALLSHSRRFIPWCAAGFLENDGAFGSR